MISQCNPLDTDYQAPTKSSWGYIIWKFWKHRFHQLVHKLKADFYAPYMCVALWTWCCIRSFLRGDQIIALTIHLVAITAVWGHISIKPSSPAIFEVMYLHPYLWRLVASTDKSNLEITWSKASLLQNLESRIATCETLSLLKRYGATLTIISKIDYMHERKVNISDL